MPTKVLTADKGKIPCERDLGLGKEKKRCVEEQNFDRLNYKLIAFVIHQPKKENMIAFKIFVSFHLLSNFRSCSSDNQS